MSFARRLITFSCLTSLVWVAATWAIAEDRTALAGDVDNLATPLRPELLAPLSDTTSPASVTDACAETALPNDGGTSGSERAPNLKNRFGRSVYLILATEMSAAGIAPGASFSAIGWSFQTAPGLSGAGPLIVYMENTSDTVNTKSVTWTTAITGMTIVHNAATTVPNVTGPWDVTLSGGSPFTYTGGGLYVAFDAQYPVGTLSTTTVVWCNGTGLTNGLKGAQGASAPTTIASSSFRPETRLILSTPILNDASVDYVLSYGAVPRDLVGPQVVEAVVTNRGANSLTNLPVSLNVSGVDSFTDTQTVPSLAACGGQTTVAFAGFTPGAFGGDTVTVSVPADDRPSNSARSVHLDVTVSDYSFKYAFTSGAGGIGITGATGAIVAKFTTTVAASVTAANVEFAAASGTTYRVAVYADSGSTTPGALLYLDGADRTVVGAGPVSIPIGAVAVGPGDFYVGIHQTNTINASVGYDREVPVRSGKFFVAAPLPVTTWSDLSPGNDFKLNFGAVMGCGSDGQCNDGDYCNGHETCAGGSCVTGTPVSCNDGLSCTIDSCDPGDGCINQPINCPDNNACTTDSCVEGVGCVFTPISCDDGNPCTSDSCTQLAGCVHSPVPNPGEVGFLTVGGPAKQTIVWSSEPVSTLYDVVRGDLDALPVGPMDGDEICFGDRNTTSTTDAQTPLPGHGFWYVVRGVGCDRGTYGEATAGTRQTATCD